MIPFSPPDISDIEIQQVVEVLKSGWITTGPKTKELEKKLAEFCCVSKMCCLNSATSALELCLRILGIGPGDEVITSAYTYSASCSPICRVGATPVLVDVAPGSFHIDIGEVFRSITEKTKAVIPVDIAGVMCDYDSLFSTLESKRSLYRPNNRLQECFNRVVVISDAAHALGARYKGRKAGEVADFTTFSFHAVKNFTTAEGGALCLRDREGIDNEALYNEVQLQSLYGQSKDAFAKTKLGSWEYDIVYPGYKCNMTDIMAGIGLGQLRRYPSLLQRRREMIGIYNEAFKDLPMTFLSHYTDTQQSSGHLYLLRLDGYTEQMRNKFILRMAEAGIVTNVHYKPLPMYTAYKNLGFDIENFPNSYNQYVNEVTLPLYTSLSVREMERIYTNVYMTLHR